MSVLLFTDPHLGTPRAANTTPTSALALQQALFDQAINVAGGMYSDPERDQIVCLGDVFDKFANPESVQKQGLELVSECRLVLSGNHDVQNQADKFGSLQFVDHAIRSLRGFSPCPFAEFGQPCVRDEFIQGNLFTAIPHVASQTLFEESLGMALEPDRAGDEVKRILLLHCNYNLSQAFATETSLNLLDEHVEELLEKYDYIVLGHEHKPADHYDGRLIVLGNTHPTGFGDISDKRIAVWDGNGFRFENIWSQANGYAEYDCGAIPRSTAANFVRVKGLATTSGILGITKAVAEMWGRSKNLYGVKMELTLPEMAGVDGKGIASKLSQLPDIIRRELEGDKKLLSLWDQLISEVGE